MFIDICDGGLVDSPPSHILKKMFLVVFSYIGISVGKIVTPSVES